MFSFIKNLFSSDKYKNDSESVIISCFFNPTNSEYRIKAFNIWYESIKHLNHRIIECAIGDDEFQLPEDENMVRVRANNQLWHKETLLNNLIKDLPAEFKYVMWVDADLIFTNKNWMVEAAEELRYNKRIVQLFEYCVHLEKDEMEPSFDLEQAKRDILRNRNPMLWKGYGATYDDSRYLSNSHNYDVHGHVGFAWGAQRSLLEEVPLYDKALVGGADHIIAHAATGQIIHPCIEKSFTEDLDEIKEWSLLFYAATKGRLGYVHGDVYHIWHGSLDKRQYLKRIREFTPIARQSLVRNPTTNLFESTDNTVLAYAADYFASREDIAPTTVEPVFQGFGGGDTGGAGAGGSWDTPDAVSSTHDQTGTVDSTQHIMGAGVLDQVPTMQDTVLPSDISLPDSTHNPDSILPDSVSGGSNNFS